MYIITKNNKIESPLSIILGDNKEEVCFAENDADALQKLKTVAEAFNPAEHDGIKKKCILILRDSTTLWLLLTAELSEKVKYRLDLFVTTLEDLCAKSLLSSGNFFLDRDPIGSNSHTTIHFVIFGSSQLTEAFATNVALVAHYPNYCYNHTLRTRITIIDDNALNFATKMRNRYSHLFENSYYRTLDLDDVNPRINLHKPLYNSSREDFIDIEWEFVKGNVYSDAVRMKLQEWAKSTNQQLTIAITHDDTTQCVSEAYNLPENIYEKNIPVLCNSSILVMEGIISNQSIFSNIQLVSLTSIDHDFICNLHKLAMNVNYIYDWISELKKLGEFIAAPVNIVRQEALRKWQVVGNIQLQYSNICNAMTIYTKLHSIGYEPSTDGRCYNALSLDEINLLVEVEHNRWNVEKLLLGFRPVNDEEQKEIEENALRKNELKAQRIHYDIRAFNDLRKDQTGKNVKIYDWALTQAIPLILKSKE